jgi:nucleotide-binding universal stress UspA family protein
MGTAFHTIGCCIDHGPAWRAVVDEGVRLAGRDGGAVRLVHVLRAPPPLRAGPYTYVEPPEVAHADEGRWLAERVATVPGAAGVLLEGDPARAICAWADESRADLLIVAPHRGPLDRAVHGSLARAIALHAPCPVLVLHTA